MEIKHLSQDEIAAHEREEPGSEPKEWAISDDDVCLDFFDTEAEAKAALDECNLTDRVDEAFREWAQKTASEVGVELAKVLEKVREVLEIRYPPEAPADYPPGTNAGLP